jgi:TonB family protein
VTIGETGDNRRNLEEKPSVETCKQGLEERIDLVVLQQKKRAGGIGLAIAVSAVVHTALVILFIRSYREVPAAANVPIARYVELIKQNPSKPRELIEAPGPKLERAPSLDAPLSDANREASAPKPTGPKPTKRPGDGRGLYSPPRNPNPPGPQRSPAMPSSAPMAQAQPAPRSEQAIKAIDTDRLVFRQPTADANASAGVDWRTAIKEVGKVASLGGGHNIDLGQFGGGEQGYAKEGPLSFESEWFNWGEYALSMVSRIRVNWYGNMPQLIRTGMSGVVTIRFTIHRDGRISNIEILKSSGIPPYDYAARKAIELSSPLNPLPKDFPNQTERVTCMFYYNMDVPK